jgi:hypothetical protein
MFSPTDFVEYSITCELETELSDVLVDVLLRDTLWEPGIAENILSEAEPFSLVVIANGNVVALPFCLFVVADSKCCVVDSFTVVLGRGVIFGIVDSNFLPGKGVVDAPGDCDIPATDVALEENGDIAFVDDELLSDDIVEVTFLLVFGVVHPPIP